MADDVQVRFGAQIEGLIAGVEAVKAQISTISAPINSVVSSFGEMKEALLAAFAIDKGAEFVDHITGIGEQILRATEMTGLSAEEFQTLQYAMKVTGTETGNLGIVIDRLERNIALARGGSGQAVQAFQTLGVTMADLKEKSPYEIIQKIADGFHNLKDPILAAGAATEVGSRGFAQMLPALKSGSDGLKEFGEAFKQTGSYLNDAQAGAFAKTHESLIELETALQGTGVQLVRTLKPAIDLVVTALTGLIEAINWVIGKFADLVSIIEGSVLVVIAKVIEQIEDFGAESVANLEKVKIAWQALGRTIEDVRDGQLSEVSSEWNIANAQMEVASKKAGVAIQEYGRQYQDLVGQIAKATGALTNFWGNLGEKPGERGGGGALGTNKEDGSAEKNEIAIEKSDLQRNLELYRLDVAAKKDADDAKVASGQMTKQAELADLMNLVGQERDVVLGEITEERDLYDRDSADWEELNNKKLIVAKQYANELARLNAQSAQAQAADLKKLEESYKSMFSSIDRAMDGALQGVLQGIQTFSQATARLFGDMVTSMLEDIAKLTLRWSAFEASKGLFGAGDTVTKAIGEQVPTALGGTQQNSVLNAAMTKLAAVMGINTAAHTAGTVATTGNTVATASDTVATGSSTVATTAGTLATSVNTTTTASSGFLHIAALAENTLATAANTIATDLLKIAMFIKSILPSFAVGNWNVQSDMVAQIHAGEMIVPAAQAAQIRNGAGFGGSASYGGGSGGGNYTININAIDTQTGAQFLKANASVIAQTLSGQVRNFNPALRAN
ncbi:MAG TPA: hypothetical protein VHW09_26835 [Bryobacteraceae bacterium]|jgi:hypothetical protein|nr:hypothetical protein [Bryobacteraceae bacterium]